MLSHFLGTPHEPLPYIHAESFAKITATITQSLIEAGRLYKQSRKRFSRVESCSILLPPERKRLETQNKKGFVFTNPYILRKQKCER